MSRRASLAALVVVAFSAAPAAHAKLALQFDRAAARPGERVSLRFGQYFTNPDHVVHVYLIRASILGRVIRPEQGGGGSRVGPPSRIPGVVKVGRTSSAEAGLAFRVPNLRGGRYAAAIWCSTCPYPYVLASFPSSVPDDAYVRAGRTLLRILR